MSTVSALRRIGHKGADLIVPGNTPASFDAALAHGVDMIEFDVLEHEGEPAARPRLRARRRRADARGGPRPPRAAPVRRHRARRRPQAPGYEERAVEALREHGLVERTLISTMWMRSLIVLRELEPRLRLGWSVPRLKTTRRSRGDQAPGLRRRALAAREAAVRGERHILAGRCDALMAHWRLVTPRLVRAIKEAGGELYVWTVDDGPRIGRLERLGVTGVITNDPRLFGQLPSAQVAAE